MLLLFIVTLLLITNKKPVVLMPGLYGSNLYVSYDKNTKVPWYCPKKMKDEVLWIRTKFLLPPLVNCIAYLTQNEFDNDTQTIHGIPGVNITVKDFGGKKSVDYIVKTKTGKFSFIDCFGSMINYFENRGYEVGKDFFVASYDWRIAPLFIDDYWLQLRQLIEKVYYQSNGQKVTLVGFSMGCFMIQQFLASEQLIKNSQNQTINGRPIWTSIKNPIIDESWKEKYIEKVIFIAPSIGGTFKVFDGMVRRFSPLIPFYRTEHIADMSTSIPGFYSHWPNYEVFKDYQAARGPDGRNYTTEQLRDLVYNYSNIKQKFIPIMDISIDLQRQAPEDIGENIPLTIIYNTKIPTTSFLDYTKGWNHDPVRYFELEGDGTVPAQGIKYVCDNWKAENRSLICIDLENNDQKKFEHGSIPMQPLVLDLVYNATNGAPESGQKQWWMKKGKQDVHLSQDHEKNVF